MISSNSRVIIKRQVNKLCALMQLALKSSLPSAIDMEGRKEICYLTTHSTHFIYGYMASDIW